MSSIILIQLQKLLYVYAKYSVDPYFSLISGTTWLLITLSMIGKYLTSVIFTLMYIYTSEVYATSIRGTGLSVSSSAARIGATVGAYTGLLVSSQSYNYLDVKAMNNHFKFQRRRLKNRCE